MKKILLGAVVLLIGHIAAAQKKLTPDQLDKAIANKAAIFTLKADNNLLDLNESTILRVQISVFDKPPAEAGPNDVNFNIDYDYDTSNPAKEPYKIQNWQILAGGPGHLSGTNDIANYIAATSMPAQHSATVSVDLIPNRPGLPKIQLLQVINIEDGPMAFTFDAPSSGINNEKYTFSDANPLDAAAKLKPPPGAAVDPAQMAKLAALQAQLAQVRGQAAAATSAQGFNLDALMNVSKALYVADGDLTSILINGPANVTKGNTVTGKKNIIINITFPGKTTGVKTLKTNKSIAAYITIDRQLAFGCSNDPNKNPDEKAIHCGGGTITISSYTTTELRGTIHAQLEGYQCTGTLNGKFIAKVANH